MADVITRFKLETTQYDSKLRDVAKSLKEYSHTATMAGSEFGKFTQKNIEAARSFGNISTSATNAKDKVKELVGAYNDVAKAYNALTKEQQKSDFGKAMSQSLQTLQGRIKDAKEEMNSTGGILDKLASKFVVSFDAVKMFNVGLQASEGALKVAKDAFFASEANVDEWARVVAASDSVYEGFLTAINNGDISGYLTRIDQIVQAAREAYNELDKLGTMRTIQGPQFSKQEAENTRMRMMIMTGRYIAPAAGTGMKAAMAEGTVLTPEQIRRIEQKLESGMKSIGALTKNELAQTGKAIDAYYNKLAVTNGMSRSEFRQGTSSWDEFSRRMQGYEDYKRWDAQARAEFARQGGRGYVDFDKSNPYAEYRKWGTFRVDKMGENSFNDLVGLIKQQQQQTNQLYSQMGQNYRTINRAEGITVKGIMNGKGGSGGGGGKGGGNEITYAADSITAQQALVQQLTKQWNEAGADVRDQYLQPLVEAEAKLKEMQNTMALQKARAEGKFNGVNLWQGDIDDISGGKRPQFAETPKPKDFLETMKGFSLKQQVQLELTEQDIKVDEETIKTFLQDAIQNGIDGMDLQFYGISEQIAKGINIDNSVWQGILDQYNKLRAKIGLAPIKINFDTGGLQESNKVAGETTKNFTAAAGAVRSVGSAMQSIEDPTTKVVGMIAEAVASIALGFSQAIGKDIGKKGNIWYGIAAAAAGIASMVSTISQIHSATGYAQGGIIKGNSYSGDNIGGVVDNSQMVGLNAGEVVLTRAMQSNLANTLEGGGMRTLNVVGKISGTDILLSADRSLRLQGKELAVWGRG